MPRDPAGIHGVIWDQIGREPFGFPPRKDRAAVSYETGDEHVGYVEPLAVGDVLSDRLFLSRGIWTANRSSGELPCVCTKVNRQFVSSSGGESPMFSVDVFQKTLAKIVTIFSRLGIRFHLTGGLNATAYGEPRMTQDIDLVIDPVQSRHLVDELAASLAEPDEIA